MTTRQQIVDQHTSIRSTVKLVRSPRTNNKSSATNLNSQELLLDKNQTTAATTAATSGASRRITAVTHAI